MRSFYSYLATLVFFGGCSYSLDSTNQDIVFVKPEAQDAQMTDKGDPQSVLDSAFSGSSNGGPVRFAPVQ